MTAIPKIDNIDSEIRNIMNNNWNNIELINNINMILHNYDNGKYVDKDIVDKFLNLKEHVTEVMRATNDLTLCIKSKIEC